MATRKNVVLNVTNGLYGATKAQQIKALKKLIAHGTQMYLHRVYIYDIVPNTNDIVRTGKYIVRYTSNSKGIVNAAIAQLASLTSKIKLRN